jgi:Gas vesicle synthesis protein GvpL/GvpF
MSTQATYTYAVARAFDEAALAAQRGVDGAPVYLVRHRDIVAVASALPEAAADEAAWRGRLETLDELAVLARCHHAVVAAAAAQAVTIPFRLATVHFGDDRVAELLRREYPRLAATLDRLAGRVELGVKVYAEAPPAPPAGSGQVATGRDYLRQRRQERDQREQAWRHATAAADRLAAGLAQLAVASRRHRPQDGRLWPAGGPNVMNAAYLVAERTAGAFADRARGLAADMPGVRVEVTGPWAPYSFADVSGTGR